MKKLLSFLTLISFSITGVSSVVSCAGVGSIDNNEENKDKFFNKFAIYAGQTGQNIIAQIKQYGETKTGLKMGDFSKVSSIEVGYKGQDISNDNTIQVEKAEEVNVVVTLNSADEQFKYIQTALTAAGLVLGEKYSFDVNVGESISKSDISHLNLQPIDFEIMVNQTYDDLNRNTDLLNLILDILKINSTGNINLTLYDFTITNDQNPSDIQNIGTINVTVTATEDSILIMGQFTVSVNLTAPIKHDITNVKVADLNSTADYSKTFIELNDDDIIVNAVIDAIKQQLNINTVSKNDFTITNDKPESDVQSKGTVTFTVTAKTDSYVLEKSFTFINTLAPALKVDISAYQISDPQTQFSSNPQLTYIDLNQNQEILDLVVNKIKSETNYIDTIIKSNIIISNDAANNSSTDYIKDNSKVTFTVAIKGNAANDYFLGSFTFINTIKVSYLSN